MSVDENTVRRIARLAHIALNEDQVAPLAQELSSILDWVEQLNELDTSQVPAMASAVDTNLKMREDVVTEGNLQDAVTRNAPGHEDGFFAVPKVVE